jgi:hypothetical protein
MCGARLHTRVLSRVGTDPRQIAVKTNNLQTFQAGLVNKQTQVVLANFSDTPLVVPKSTVIGLAEPVSETLV